MESGGRSLHVPVPDKKATNLWESQVRAQLWKFPLYPVAKGHQAGVRPFHNHWAPRARQRRCGLLHGHGAHHERAHDGEISVVDPRPRAQDRRSPAPFLHLCFVWRGALLKPLPSNVNEDKQEGMKEGRMMRCGARGAGKGGQFSASRGSRRSSRRGSSPTRRWEFQLSQGFRQRFKRRRNKDISEITWPLSFKR